jgi:hypothetical protein
MRRATAILLLWALPAHAERGLVWVAQPVRAPVDPDAVRPTPPFVPAAVAEIAGEATVGPERGAALWLDALDVVRVRAEPGARPRFQRVLGPGAGGSNAGARALLDEPGVAAAPGVWYLSQPPGRGDVWLIDAREPTRVTVERPVVRRGRLVWTDVQDEILDWIDADGAPPELPLVDGSAGVRLTLAAERELGRALVKLDPALAPAVRSWRKASAVLALLPLRPLNQSFFFVDEVDLPGTGDGVPLVTGDDELDRMQNQRAYRRAAAAESHAALELDGPGVLRVETRAFLGRQIATRPPVAVAVRSGGELLGRAVSDSGPARPPAALLPPPAFPSFTPLVTGDGDWVGERVAITLPLFPGRHRYEIELSGGPLIVRAAVARYRPRLGQPDGPERFLADARAGIGAGPASQWLYARLERLAGNFTPPKAAMAELPKLLAIGLRPADADALALLAALPARAPADVRGYWLLELARGLAGRGDGDGLRRLLAGLAEVPPPEVLGPLAELLPEPTLAERLRSAAVGALDIAWRARPADPGLVRRYAEAWRAGAWSLLAPSDPGHGAPLRAATWLETPSPGPPGIPPDATPGALVRLPLGRPRRLRALPSPDGTRTPLAQVYVATPAATPGPVVLRVRGQRFATLALAPVEVLEVALPPGDHDVELDGPAGTVGFASLLPPPEVPLALDDSANLRHYWPIALGGEPLHVPLPDPRVPGPIRVALRALGGAGDAIKVAIHTDVGERRVLTFYPGGPDPETRPVDPGAAPARRADGDGAVSGEVTVTFRPPPGARELWLTAGGNVPIVASVAVRRYDAPPATVPPPASAPDPLARLAALSRTIADRADAADALAERAHLLFDLGQGDLARQDLVRLAGRAARLEDRLLARLDSWAEPTDIGLPNAARPVPLAPALLALAADPAVLTPLVPAARAARERGAEAARTLLKGDDSMTGYLAARLGGSPLDLVRLYAQTGSLAVGLEAAAALARQVADDSQHAPRGAGALLYGLAARLGPEVDHPALRRAGVLGAALSRWETLEGTEANAGQERLYLLDAPPTTPVGAVREALLAPPWSPRRAHTLMPGTAAALDVALGAAGHIAADIWCQELKLGPDPGACPVTVRVDGTDLRAGTVAPGQLVSTAPRALAAGKHHLEVGLGTGDPNVMASVRFLTDRTLSGAPPSAREERGYYPVPVEKPAHMFAAEKTQPVQVTVLGPATLHVELRGLGPKPPTVTVRAVPSRGASVVERVETSAEPDPGARGEPGRSLAPMAPVQADLLLPDASPYRVTLQPDAGRVLARIGLRVDAPGAAPPPLPPPWWQGASLSAILPWPALPAPLATVDGEVWDASSPFGAGTFSLELSGGSQPIGDQDSALQNFEAVAQTVVSWRKQVVDEALWLRLSPMVRYRQDADGAIWGGTAEAYAQGLPLDLRADLHGGAFTQQAIHGQQLSFTGGLRLDRPFQLGDGLYLVGSTTFRWALLTLEPKDVAVGDVQHIDADVYNQYLATHAIGLIPRLSLWWTPYQDHIFEIAGFMTTERDLHTPDYIGATLDWRALLPILGDTATEIIYRPTYRFQNSERDTAFVRHDLTAGLRWSLWTGGTGRLLLGADLALFIQSGGTNQTFTLSLRYDLTNGRGLRDVLPPEQSFDVLVERLPWEPTPPGVL